MRKDSKRQENFPASYHCLGYLYQRGYGVDLNLQEAFRWYDQGAKAGDVACMLALARMYENSTKPDRVTAFIWFFNAVMHKNQGAVAEVRRIRLSMTGKKWKNAQKKLPRDFDPKKVDSFLRRRKH